MRSGEGEVYIGEDQRPVTGESVREEGERGRWLDNIPGVL